MLCCSSFSVFYLIGIGTVPLNAVKFDIFELFMCPCVEITLIYQHFWRWSKSSSRPSASPWHPHAILWLWWMKLKVWSIKLRLQRAPVRSLLTGWDCKTSERLNTLQAESRKDRYFVNESSHLPFCQQHRAHAGRCQLWNLTTVVLLHNRDISSRNLWGFVWKTVSRNVFSN